MSKKNRIRNRKVEDRQLDELVDFPMQEELFPVDEAADAALAADIAENGLKTIPHILPENKAGYPPNTILNGHRRIRALRHTDAKETQVLVRQDLAAADKATIEREFIKDNKERRQLSKLGQARLARRLMEIEKRRSPGRLSPYDEPELRERIGKELKLSGRHVDRLLNILKTPPPVQLAYDLGQVPVAMAEKVSRLPEQTQQTIAAAIEAGENAKQTIQEHLSKQQKKARGSVIRSLMRNLKQSNHQLEEHDQEAFTGRWKPEDLAIIRQTHKLCGRLLKEANNP